MKREGESAGIPEALLEKARELSRSPSGPVTVRPLCGDGSDRKFFRIACGTSTFVALVSPRTQKDATDENDSYLNIGRHLRQRGIPAPLILYADARQGEFLLEDAGDVHLQTFVRRSPSGVETIYRWVLRLLVSMHRKAPDGFLPEFCFDTQIYDARFIFERELEYFRKNFAVRFLGLEAGDERLLRDFENLAQAAAEIGRASCRERV
jgi:aminoglycoside/choline kinase family phosphotransferase